MKRASELFTMEIRSSESRFVGRTWLARSVPEDAFVSVAAAHWVMCVTRRHGETSLTVRGPETRATLVPIPADAEFLGIDFNLGAYMPMMPPGPLVDRAVTLPQPTSTSVWLDGTAWELPRLDTADVFVDRLVRAGLLVHDPVASAAVQGDATGLSRRSVERRVRRATGLTRGAIRQIRRAGTAVELLSGGVPARDVARRAGYADQPHMTRSLQRLVGQTPSRVAASTAPGP
jgi:Helix-turn-helix domain